MENALLNATNAGVIIVIASGNESLNFPGWPGKFASDPKYKGRIIIAGSLAQDDTMAPSSNKADTWGNYYISAPGVSVLADCDATSCWRISGTSFAAPHVAGAMALVLEAFPNLSVDDAIKVIMESARDLGSVGIDSVFGRGALDLSRAFSPLGTMSSQSSSGALISLNSFSAVSGIPYGDAFARSNLEAGIYDKFGRSFNLNLGSKISSAPVSQSNMRNSQYKMRTYNAAGADISWLESPKPAKAWGFNENPPLENKFAFTKDIAQIDGLGTISYSFSNLGNLPYNREILSNSGDAFGIFALQDSNNIQSLSLDAKNLKLSILGTKSDNLDFAMGRMTQTLQMFDAKWVFKYGVFGFEYGANNEIGSALGFKQTSNYGQVQAKTQFAGINSKFNLSDSLFLNARAQFAKPKDLMLGNIFTEIDPGIADAYEVSLEKYLGNGNLSFRVSQKLRMRSGSFALNLADPFTDWNSPMTYSMRKFSLAPDGREIKFMINRDIFTSQNANFSYGFEGIKEANHFKDAPDIFRIYFGGNLRF